MDDGTEYEVDGHKEFGADAITGHEVNGVERCNEDDCEDPFADIELKEAEGTMT